MHQDCQQKLFDELLTIMPNPDVDLTPIHINKMVYLDQCMRETQRLFPTVPLIGRTAVNEPVNIKGYDIPPNIPIFIGIRQIHRKQEYYGPTALLFNPDRFKPNEHHPNKDQQGIYLPFSLGPRNCIGKFYCVFFFLLLSFHSTFVCSSVSIFFLSIFLLLLREKSKTAPFPFLSFCFSFFPSIFFLFKHRMHSLNQVTAMQFTQ